jgi:3-oxoacyl-[acyl-carrier protein] reductase
VSLSLLGRASAALDETRAAVLARGARAECIPCDLRDADQTTAAARRALDVFGAPDVVVQNAGVVRRGPIEAATTDDWDEQLDVNLRAPFLLTRELLPSMRATNRGRIIHVASISATVGSRHAAAYAASKWGLVGFMKSLAEELSGTGLMTVAILPGSVDTEMLEGSGFSPRMTAEHVARTIVYYAREAPLAHNGGVVEMFGV